MKSLDYHVNVIYYINIRELRNKLTLIKEVKEITDLPNQSNGNGSGQYSPEVEFEYLDADVWIEEDAEGNKDVAYTKDVEEALELEDKESDKN